MRKAKKNPWKIIFASLILLMGSIGGYGQISPGELSKVHASLDGMANCTKCHKFGEKISNEKCLACHTEIKSRTDKKKGYHSSSEVTSKTCITCHSDHHGRNFEIIHFDKNKFDHNLTGYKLEGVHAKKECEKCHKATFVTDSDPIIKKKSSTYLGLTTECFGCHEDVHQRTLSNTCTNCHTNEAFKPASKFDHSKAKFQLKGKHSTVLCKDCHKTIVQNGKSMQQFIGLQFSSCVNCHKDVHKDQFGQNCTQCHTEESFKAIKGISKFDHAKTGYVLVGKHLTVACKSCHKVSLTTPLPHDKCTSCHVDYHKGEFSKAGKSPECTQCHSMEGFKTSSYTIEQHNLSGFKLEGGHLAAPCFECHKKGKDWKFKEVGKKCAACHENIHRNIMDIRFIPDDNCESCHNVNTWKDVKFDHKLTSFPLEGKHTGQTCRKCHFDDKADGSYSQKFASLKSGSCEACHTDVHRAQFKENNQTLCSKCHGFEIWKPAKFNHDSTRFKLDGAHQKVACVKCHKPVKEGETTYINYKLKDTKCTSCHLR